MARMHSSGRGASGSTKPKNPSTSWVEYSKSEVVSLVEKLSKKGNNPSEIGRILRDQYGVPSVKEITGEKVTEVLEEKEMKEEPPEDLNNLIEKAKRIKDHLEEHPKDLSSIRRLKLVEAKIRRLSSYYKEKGELEDEWKYSRNNIQNLL